MTGKQGRSGGSRPGAGAKPGTSGGTRPGAGRPRKNLYLSLGDQVLINGTSYTVAGIAGNIITLRSGEQMLTFERVPLSTGGNRVTATERNEILSYIATLDGLEEDKIAAVMDRFRINRERAISAVATVERRQRVPTNR